MKEIGYLLLLAIFYSCNIDPKVQQRSSGTTASTTFKLIESSQSGVAFQNTIESSYDFNILEYNYFFNGSGLAVGDVNNDGLPDLFFGGNMVSSRLYMNLDSLRFNDITDQAGISTSRWISGVSMVDINTDGWLDIYACASGYPEKERRKNLLFINQQDGSFVEMAEVYGLDDQGYSTQAAWFDYDGDGDLDMYLLSHHQDKTNPNLPRPKKNSGNSPSRDRLYENTGKSAAGHPVFKEVGKQAGILHEGYGLGIAVEDFNQDGWPDIYVANDFIYDDLLYINQQNGTFQESAHQYFKHTSRFSMGTDAADINNDGRPEIITLDMHPEDNKRQKLMNTAMNYDSYQLALSRNYLPQFSRNTLQVNNGNINGEAIPFSEVGQFAGISQTDWSWSALFADFDNDGLKDLFVSNGIPKDITDSDFIKFRDSQIYEGGYNYDTLKKELLKKVETLAGVNKSNFIFKNDGDVRFSDMTNRWGIEQPSYSNSAIYADLDNDGDLEIVTNNINEQAFIFRNNTAELSDHHFLRVALQGSENNPLGIGSKVQIVQKDKSQTVYHSPYRGFQSSIDPILHVGLGQDSIVDQIQVIWPDQKIQILKNISANQVVKISYENATEIEKPAQREPERIFTELVNLVQTTHEENDFADFKLEPLLPHKFSQNGPGLAVGDVNNDGLDDFWLGGAHQQAGKIFIQQPNQEFDEQLLPDQNFEDMGGLLFDADEDGDLDLYVVSGGYEFNANTAAYQDRLYVNDGKGNFLRNKSALPTLYSSGSCVAAADFDHDGDLDLFVGGRVTPARYPLPPQSYLLRNDNGTFVDVSSQIAPELSHVGMVTSALWTDFDNDDKIDLLVVGEWMPLTFFKNTGISFENVTDKLGLTSTTGWWNSITGADFDQDGDTDYVAGNVGWNTPWKVSLEKPLKLWANDFDRNGSLDAILSHFKGEREVPIAAKDALVQQLVMMRKRFPSYLSYAEADIPAVLTDEERRDAYQLEAKTMTSSYIENRGSTTFSVTPLPSEAQWAPIFGILTGDFNGDGYTDILAQGNSYATEFVYGQYDALRGVFLAGDGRGNFTLVPSTESGFAVENDRKSLARITINRGQTAILSTANNGSLQLFTPKNQSSSREVDDKWVYAIVKKPNDKQQKYEFYWGAGYLSQIRHYLHTDEEVTEYRSRKADSTTLTMSYE